MQSQAPDVLLCWMRNRLMKLHRLKPMELIPTSRGGELSFTSRDSVAKNTLPSRGYPRTSTQSAEQPLDCSYRSFNIPPLIAFKMVVRPHSSKWDLLVWISSIFRGSKNLELQVKPFKPLRKGEYISETIISKKQSSRHNCTL